MSLFASKIVFQCQNNSVPFMQQQKTQTMRQKRQRKPRKMDEEGLGEQYRQRRISKQLKHQKKKTKKDQSDEQNIKLQEERQQLSQEKEQQVDKQGIIQKNKKNKQNEIDIEEEKRLKEPKNNQQQLSNQNKLTCLTKLNLSFQEIKAAHQENLAKYNFHKNQCEELGIKVSQSNKNIQSKAKELRELSKTIYNQTIQANRQEFLNPNTFQHANKLQDFINNLITVTQVLSTCPYQDPLLKFKLTKLYPESLITITKQFKVGQHKKQKIIKEYIQNFPYLTIGEQYIPVIQALIHSTKFIQKQSAMAIQQFPCLFMRESEISYRLIQKFNSILYKLVKSNENKVINSIYQISKQICKQVCCDGSLELIEELVFKGITKIKFIILPEIQFEIRGFSYRGSIYINTYYIQKQSSLSKEVYLSYCILTAFRELANLVVNSLLYCLNKNDEDIGKNISDVRDRVDAGAQLQKMLTGGNDFVCASIEDYQLFQESVIKFQMVGKNNNQFALAYVFEEERKKKDIITSSLFSKYEVNVNEKNCEELIINDKQSNACLDESKKDDEYPQQRKCQNYQNECKCDDDQD